eukprot:gnl/Chilomastix_cuspidata/4301.p1 GENE.gnl/Chilomastix_cuspidata/4301~~gnl/Chilomastix_cuspidata/4301.p1  ORF type:complete len:553 (-),score=237.92 gnl/Chilomastix_cuspidata/4301:46-1704(-)
MYGHIFKLDPFEELIGKREKIGLKKPNSNFKPIVDCVDHIYSFERTFCRVHTDQPVIIFCEKCRVLICEKCLTSICSCHPIKTIPLALKETFFPAIRARYQSLELGSECKELFRLHETILEFQRAARRLNAKKAAIAKDRVELQKFGEEINDRAKRVAAPRDLLMRGMLNCALIWADQLRAGAPEPPACMLLANGARLGELRDALSRQIPLHVQGTDRRFLLDMLHLPAPSLALVERLYMNAAFQDHLCGYWRQDGARAPFVAFDRARAFTKLCDGPYLSQHYAFHTDPHVAAAVSRKGILAVLAPTLRKLFIFKMSKKGFRLVAEHAAVCKPAFVAFYGDTLFVGVVEEFCLRAAPAEELKRGAAVEWERWLLPGGASIANACAQTSLTPWTGTLVFLNQDERPVLYNVARHTCKIFKDVRARQIVDPTGVWQDETLFMFEDTDGCLARMHLSGFVRESFSGLGHDLRFVAPLGHSATELATTLYVTTDGQAFTLAGPLYQKKKYTFILRIEGCMFLTFTSVNTRFKVFSLAEEKAAARALAASERVTPLR